jgi:hypothetical protein
MANPRGNPAEDPSGNPRGNPAATLGFLQDELEAIYGVTAPRVADFLLGLEAAQAVGQAPSAPEQLFVLEEEGGLALGLYLDEDVLRVAAAAEPHHRRPLLVRRRVLRSLSCAAEGVSHFVYLSTRAAEGRCVSLLELEVQAEVDKFALLVLHLWRRGLRRMSRALRRRLYERVRYHAHLGHDELSRYREANRLGGGYARFLEGRYVEDADLDGLLRELRRSYRLGAAEKLGYLGARGH